MNPRTLLRRSGRAVLWITVAVLLARGLAATLHHDTPPTSAARPAGSAPPWPDDQARAFAVAFTTTYLTRAPNDTDTQILTLQQRFTSPELATAMTTPIGVEPTGSKTVQARQTVQTATVASTSRLDDEHALITISARTTTGTLHLAVPVARHNGGLSVYDLPGLVAAPQHQQAPPPDTEPLASAADVDQLLARFFKSYLAGDTGALAYLTPAGVRIPALTDPLEPVGTVEAHQAAPEHQHQLLVLADVQARDPRTHGTYALRYRLLVTHADRWYVTALNPQETRP